MKKLFLLTIFVLSCLTLSCQNSTVNAPTQNNTQEQQVSAEDLNTTEKNTVNSEASQDDQATNDTTTSQATTQNIPENAEGSSTPSESNDIPDRVIQIPKTGPKAFVSQGLKQAPTHIKLTIKSHHQEDNLSDDWFERNQFDKPTIAQTIEGYTITPTGVRMEYPRDFNQLIITDPKGQKTLFDFTNYFIKDDTWGFYVSINYATIKDGILYVALAQPTYSSFNPDTAFIMALDMEGNILWRSNTLVSNASNFLIIDNTIICGYGFTDEPDHIYTLDLNTGKTISKVRIKNGPDYFILTDKNIRVLTYDQDYTINFQ